ncbi:MAG: hypothetical protein LBN39_09655 [Planctomycetaceae bacterium]|nr:hypothetical protein [Planctomycetaceae bacterium]
MPNCAGIPKTTAADVLYSTTVSIVPIMTTPEILCYNTNVHNDHSLSFDIVQRQNRRYVYSAELSAAFLLDAV